MIETSEDRGRAMSRLLVLILAVCTLSLSCGDDAAVGPIDEEEPPEEENFGLGAQILGVCFMDEENCVSSYVDLGEYTHGGAGKVAEGIPAYMFPSLQIIEGGVRNPYDSTGLYHPFRLQNNVFAEAGRVWDMFAVYSGSVNLIARPVPGMVMWGVGADTTVGDPDDIKSYLGRDLFANPFTSETEILEAEARGDIKIARMGLVVDCPMVPVDEEDIVINLNPSYSLCASSIAGNPPSGKSTR